MTLNDDFLYFESMRGLADWHSETTAPHIISNTPLANRPAIVPPTTITGPPPITKLLLCHDFKGGFHPTEHPQGQFPALSDPTTTPVYTAEYLNYASHFVYFSHKRVTVPPASWINLCHRNGLPCLGTLLVEHAEGSSEAGRLFERGSEGEFIHVTQLAELARVCGFDGWLINIESSFPWTQWSPMKLQAWLRELKTAMAARGVQGQVIWYDAVTVLNMVHYQNALTMLNVPFFTASDGLFTNYFWGQPLLKASEIMAKAMSRAQDVWMGIDCYGRGSFGGGGYDVKLALDVIQRAGTAVALFAPGWTYENFDGKLFHSVEKRFWEGDNADGVGKYAARTPAGTKDFFYTSFNRGFGNGFWLEGKKVYDKPWVHLGAQSLLPNTPLHLRSKGLTPTLTNTKAYTGGWALDFHHDLNTGGTGDPSAALYNLALNVTSSHSLHIVYAAPRLQSVGVDAGVYWTLLFPNGEQRTLRHQFTPATDSSAWVSASANLSGDLPSPSDVEGATVTELGVYYSGPAAAASASTLFTLGALSILIPPAPTPPLSSISAAIVRPGREERVQGRRARVVWNVYPNYSGLHRKSRAAGCWGEVTKDFAWFVVWQGGVCRGIAYGTEWVFPDGEGEEGEGEGGNGGESGKWRVDGVRWDGGVFNGP